MKQGPSLAGDNVLIVHKIPHLQKARILTNMLTRTLTLDQISTHSQTYFFNTC